MDIANNPRGNLEEETAELRCPGFSITSRGTVRQEVVREYFIDASK